MNLYDLMILGEEVAFYEKGDLAGNISGFRGSFLQSSLQSRES